MDRNNDIVKIEGHEFGMVDRGLDEKQVASFVKELVSERDELRRQREEVAGQSDTLANQEGRLASLTKLAERTIVEADKIAEEMKTEALDKAKQDSDAIIAEAREQAKQEAEEIKRKALSDANGEAETIRTDAKREAELLLKNQRRRIQEEVENKVHQLYSGVSSHFEDLKQQALTFEEEILQSLAQLVGQDSTVGTEEAFPHIQSEAVVKDETNVNPAVTAVPTANAADGIVEVEILPPVDMTKVVQFTKYLEGLAEVKNTDLVPLPDRPIIVVFLDKPIDLVEILGKHPMVGWVKEAADDEKGAVTEATYPEGEPKRIQIEFSRESAHDENK